MNAVLRLLLATTLSAGNAEFERASVRGAGEIAVARIKAEVTSRVCATGTLERAMLAESAKYASRDVARKALERTYAEAVDEVLRTKVDRALGELARARPAEEVFGSDFVRAARTLSDAETRRVLAGPYTNAFAVERQSACDAQARGLVASVRPPMSAVDGDDEGKVREALLANIAAQNGRVVFEENAAYVSQKIVEPLLADAKREKKRQQDYVRRVRTDALAPSALRAELAWKLFENVRARAGKTANAALRWEVFPSVTNRTVETSVEQRILSRLAAKAEEAPTGFDEASVRATMAADPAAHRRRDASRAAFHAAASAKILSAARAAVAAEAGGGSARELEAYLAPRLKTPSVAKRVESRLAAELDPVLARVRADAAAREFATRYPALRDGTWYPDAELADRVAARSDFTSAVRAWREMPELSELAPRAALEETDASADRAVRAAFDLARAAVAGQNRTVEDVHASVLAEAKERKESLFRRTPDLKAIVRMLTEATEARWSERKAKVLWADARPPANAARQHAELFPSVKRRIELVAKEIFEEMVRPDEPPPDEPPPEESRLEFSITVSRTGDRVNVKLTESGRDVVTRETDAKLAPFRGAMREVADKLGAEIMKLK